MTKKGIHRIGEDSVTGYLRSNGFSVSQNHQPNENGCLEVTCPVSGKGKLMVTVKAKTKKVWPHNLGIGADGKDKAIIFVDMSIPNKHAYYILANSNWKAARDLEIKWHATNINRLKGYDQNTPVWDGNGNPDYKGYEMHDDVLKAVKATDVIAIVATILGCTGHLHNTS